MGFNFKTAKLKNCRIRLWRMIPYYVEFPRKPTVFGRLHGTASVDILELLGGRYDKSVKCKAESEKLWNGLAITVSCWIPGPTFARGYGGRASPE